MNLNMINAHCWRVFQEKYPDAYAYLLGAALDAETEYLQGLTRQSLASEWQVKRLSELLGIRRKV